jgi:hypothetical protein
MVRRFAHFLTINDLQDAVKPSQHPAKVVPPGHAVCPIVESNDHKF